jgi:hypothetical protein
MGSRNSNQDHAEMHDNPADSNSYPSDDTADAEVPHSTSMSESLEAAPALGDTVRGPDTEMQDQDLRKPVQSPAIVHQVGTAEWSADAVVPLSVKRRICEDCYKRKRGAWFCRSKGHPLLLAAAEADASGATPVSDPASSAEHGPSGVAADHGAERANGGGMCGRFVENSGGDESGPAGPGLYGIARCTVTLMDCGASDRRSKADARFYFSCSDSDPVKEEGALNGDSPAKGSISSTECVGQLLCDTPMEHELQSSLPCGTMSQTRKACGEGKKEVDAGPEISGINLQSCQAKVNVIGFRNCIFELMIVSSFHLRLHHTIAETYCCTD